MSSIIYIEKNGSKYAYEATSVWNKEKKQSRSVRKYLGRVDPVTNEIIKTSGRRGRIKESDDPINKTVETNIDYKESYLKAIAEKEQLAKELAEERAKKEHLEKEHKRFNALMIKHVQAILDAASQQ